jgi:ribulose-5-phosphate 4-epimerase/fuculose-1-phosphate aldolase
MLDPIESLKEKIVLVCKVLQKQRLIDGYGHVTARLADGRILSTPHMPPGKAALRDLIIIDMQGNKLEGSGEPNGENAMHTSIYKAVPMCSVFSTIIRTNWCRQARRIRELER